MTKSLGDMTNEIRVVTCLTHYHIAALIARSLNIYYIALSLGVCVRLTNSMRLVCAIIHIPLCHENRATVPRPSLPPAGVAMHPALVWSSLGYQPLHTGRKSLVTSLYPRCASGI